MGEGNEHAPNDPNDRKEDAIDRMIRNIEQEGAVHYDSDSLKPPETPEFAIDVLATLDEINREKVPTLPLELTREGDVIDVEFEGLVRDENLRQNARFEVITPSQRMLTSPDSFNYTKVRYQGGTIFSPDLIGTEYTIRGTDFGGSSMMSGVILDGGFLSYDELGPDGKRKEHLQTGPIVHAALLRKDTSTAVGYRPMTYEQLVDELELDENNGEFKQMNGFFEKIGTLVYPVDSFGEQKWNEEKTIAGYIVTARRDSHSNFAGLRSLTIVDTVEKRAFTILKSEKEYGTKRSVVFMTRMYEGFESVEQFDVLDTHVRETRYAISNDSVNGSGSVRIKPEEMSFPIQDNVAVVFSTEGVTFDTYLARYTPEEVEELLQKIQNTIDVEKSDRQLSIDTGKIKIITPSSLMDNHFKETAEDVIGQLEGLHDIQQQMKPMDTLPGKKQGGRLRKIGSAIRNIFRKRS